MIFALLIILVFAGILAYAQFGVPFNTATAKAQVLAENMAVWHQAAMLQVEWDANHTPPVPPPVITCPANTGCTYPLNNILLGVPLNNQLTINWPEYVSMVPEGSQSGWQSFFFGNVNGQTGDSGTGASCASIPNETCTESYVLTVFRGYGGGNVCVSTPVNPCPPGTEQGATDPSNFAQGLADTVTERVGLGTLTCGLPGHVTYCQFNRITSANNPLAAMTSDKPLTFDAALLNAGAAAYFTTGAAQTNFGVNGRTAIMTRVN